MMVLAAVRWALLFLAVWSGALVAQGGMPANVVIAVAEMQSIAPVTLVPGTVVSRNDANLAAEVEGRLEQVADVGTRVVTGDLIAEIEDTSLRLLNDQLKAEVTRAEARLRFLEAEEKRFAQLADSNLAAVAQLDETRSNRDVARSDLAVAKARLAQNSDLLDRTRMLAPFGGVVVERLMTPGERVTEGDEVVRLVDHDNLEVIARAPLEYYSFVKIGQLLDVRAGRIELLARVRTVVAVGDENTHQFELRLDLDGSPFPVGQTLRVAVPQDGQREVLAVPRDALVLRSDGQTVFVIDDNNTARRILVTTGIGAGDRIEVFGMISAGDRVVIRGNERLRPGQAVNVMDG